MPRLHRLDPDDTVAAQRWDEFVLACPEATFFHRATWQQVIGEVFRHRTHYLYTVEGGEITGVLPLAHVRSWLFGNALTALPFAVYGGLACTTDAAREALLAEALKLGRELKVDHLELRHLTPQRPDWPRQDLYVTFRKELLGSDEANMQAIPRKQRAMVRKAIQRGLTSQLDEGVDRFFRLYADNVHRHGTPALPRRYFEVLRRRFGADCEVLTVSAPDGEPVSSVLSFYFRDEVLPYYAGDAERARELAANDFKYWELMRHATARGIRVFDYGRSKRGTGSFSFKKNWGFEPTPLHYEYHLYRRETVPQNNPSNAKYRLLIEAWRRMPLALANRIGPLVVRSLG
jgi:FemAB-related protein (PEP-CTERM system-associated)